MAGITGEKQSAEALRFDDQAAQRRNRFFDRRPDNNTIRRRLITRVPETGRYFLADYMGLVDDERQYYR